MPDAVDTILDQWARELPDLDRAPMGILGRIARLAKVHDAFNAQTFSKFGLQPDEFDVLATLRRHGAPFELNPRELLRTMMVASGTMTHRLDKLEKAGLIQRGADPTDRRGVLVRLTADGKRIVDDAVEAHVRRQSQLLEPLGATDREVLTDLLRRLASSVEPHR